jgi:surfeit locus 1 family protein
MTFRPYPVLTLLTAVSVVILIMFGNWQWSRYEEKTAAKATEPEWASVAGTLLPGTTLQVYTLTNGKAAWRDVMLVELAEGAVFVPQTIHYAMDAPVPSKVQAPQFFSARGLWYDAKHRNAFSTEDDTEAGLFYAFDPVEMAKALPSELAGRVQPRIFEPEVLMRTDTAPSELTENPFLRPEMEERLPPERHFGYALTWWGLAIGLIGVYLALHHQRGRLRFSKTGTP